MIYCLKKVGLMPTDHHFICENASRKPYDYCAKSKVSHIFLIFMSQSTNTWVLCLQLNYKKYQIKLR